MAKMAGERKTAAAGAGGPSLSLSLSLYPFLHFFISLSFSLNHSPFPRTVGIVVGGAVGTVLAPGIGTVIGAAVGGAIAGGGVHQYGHNQKYGEGGREGEREREKKRVRGSRVLTRFGRVKQEKQIFQTEMAGVWDKFDDYDACYLCSVTYVHSLLPLFLLSPFSLSLSLSLSQFLAHQPQAPLPLVWPCVLQHVQSKEDVPEGLSSERLCFVALRRFPSVLFFYLNCFSPLFFSRIRAGHLVACEGVRSVLHPLPAPSQQDHPLSWDWMCVVRPREKREE